MAVQTQGHCCSWCRRQSNDRTSGTSLLPLALCVIACIMVSVSTLLEWIPPSSDGLAGLDAYGGRAIDACVATISKQAKGAQPFLMGHSLGGTLAAIYCALEPRSVKGLVLLGAPLCFEPASSRFRDALVALIPEEFSETELVAGSLLSRISAVASPDTFVWSRWMDAALSLADHAAMDIHARVERWALDEVALPGKLVSQIFQWLYR